MIHHLEGKVLQQSGVRPLARLVKSTGEALAQSEVSDAELRVFEDGVLQGSATTLTVNTVMQASLQTGSGWIDSVGYNFAHQYDGSEFTTGGARYRLEYKLTTTTSDGVVWVLVDLECIGVCTPAV